MTTPPVPGQWPDPTQPTNPQGPAFNPVAGPADQAQGAGWSSPDPVPPPAAPPAPVYPAYQAPPPSSSYGAVPGYGAAPAYGQPYVVATRPTNGMALAAMIVALAGLVTCVAFPVGAVLGHVALKQVRQTGEQGEGFAKTGIIVGWIGTGLMILGCGLYAALIGFAASVSNTTS